METEYILQAKWEEIVSKYVCMKDGELEQYCLVIRDEDEWDEETGIVENPIAGQHTYPFSLCSFQEWMASEESEYYFDGFGNMYHCGQLVNGGLTYKQIENAISFNEAKNVLAPLDYLAKIAREGQAAGRKFAKIYNDWLRQHKGIRYGEVEPTPPTFEGSDEEKEIFAAGFDEGVDEYKQLMHRIGKSCANF